MCELCVCKDVLYDPLLPDFKDTLRVRVSMDPKHTSARRCDLMLHAHEFMNTVSIMTPITRQLGKPCTLSVLNHELKRMGFVAQLFDEIKII